jgi:outer membrane protein OmpA-like peptidoglycan-associated protein
MMRVFHRIDRRHSPAATSLISLWLLILASFALSACRSDPPKPTRAVSPRERQELTLRALGFGETDQGWLLSLPAAITFSFDSAEVKPAARRSISDTAKVLLRAQIRRVRLAGHTDNIGEEPFNLELSRHRADAVADIFRADGFADGDVERLGLGSRFPVHNNASSDERARNRRVEIIVPASALGEP